MPTDDATGLDSETAAARLRAEGPNDLGVSQRRSFWGIALEVVRDQPAIKCSGRARWQAHRPEKRHGSLSSA